MAWENVDRYAIVRSLGISEEGVLIIFRFNLVFGIFLFFQVGISESGIDEAVQKLLARG